MDGSTVQDNYRSQKFRLHSLFSEKVRAEHTVEEVEECLRLTEASSSPNTTSGSCSSRNTPAGLALITLGAVILIASKNGNTAAMCCNVLLSKFNNTLVIPLNLLQKLLLAEPPCIGQKCRTSGSNALFNEALCISSQPGFG